MSFRINTKDDIKESKILIAEDLEYNRSFIKDVLNAEGYYNLIFAQDGYEAIEKVEKEHPDLILLDLMMPKLDGYQTCVKLKNNKKTRGIPIVIQSAANSSKEREKAFKLGANDFINKPIEALEIVARVKIQLSQYKMLNQLLEYKEKMRQELEDARNMLLSIIPKNTKHPILAKKYNLSLASHYEPSSELGGDYFGLKEVEDHTLCFYVWDFSGHGITAAINTFRLHSLIQSMHMHRADAAVFLNMLNEYLYNMLPLEQYATMFYGVLNFETQELNYVGAGSTAPYLISFKTKQIMKINTMGYPLGVTKCADYTNNSINVKDWDSVILYSDALIETLDQHDKVFDLEKFLQDLITNKQPANLSNPSQWLLENIMNHFNVNYADRLEDDLTLSIISK